MRRKPQLGPILALTAALLAAAAFTNAASQAPAAPPSPEGQPVPEANEAMVRFLHAAPNAQVSSVVLVGDGASVEPEAFAGLSFGEMSDYVPVAVDSYEVSISLAGREEGGVIEAQTETVTPFVGEYYTIALVGLVDPEQAADQGDEGFFDWLQGLFTSNEDAFAMRTMVINDGTTAGVRQDEAEIRIAHLAPGVDELELVAVGADGDVNVLHTVSYGDVSGFGLVQPAAATLELRAAGSEAVVLDLAEVDLSTGLGHTLFLMGTPVEQVPLDALLVSNPQALAGMPGAGLAVPPGAATFDASQVALFRNNLIELEARLDAIGARLESLAGVEGAQEEVSAAQQELEAARELVFATREQIEAQPAVPTGAPAAPAADPAAPADPEAPAEGEGEGAGEG